MEVISKNLEETHKFASLFLEYISKRKGPKAMVVGLKGDLGSGKTTFTQFIAQELDIEEGVTSPTFVILKKYRIKKDFSFSTLVHIDAYRLESGEDLKALSFETELGDPNNLIFLEWPENVEEALPKDMMTLSFETINENTRKITLDDPVRDINVKKPLNNLDI